MIDNFLDVIYVHIFTVNNLTVAKLNMDGLDSLDGCGLLMVCWWSAVAGLHRLLRRQQLKLWIWKRDFHHRQNSSVDGRPYGPTSVASLECSHDHHDHPTIHMQFLCSSLFLPGLIQFLPVSTVSGRGLDQKLRHRVLSQRFTEAQRQKFERWMPGKPRASQGFPVLGGDPMLVGKPKKWGILKMVGLSWKIYDTSSRKL